MLLLLLYGTTHAFVVRKRIRATSIVCTVVHLSSLRVRGLKAREQEFALFEVDENRQAVRTTLSCPYARYKPKERQACTGRTEGSNLRYVYTAVCPKDPGQTINVRYVPPKNISCHGKKKSVRLSAHHDDTLDH